MSLLNLNFKIFQHYFRLLAYGLKALLGNFYLNLNLSFYVQLNKNNYMATCLSRAEIFHSFIKLLTYIENKPLLKDRQVERFVEQSSYIFPQLTQMFKNLLIHFPIDSFI